LKLILIFPSAAADGAYGVWSGWTQATRLGSEGLGLANVSKDLLTCSGEPLSAVEVSARAIVTLLSS